MNLNISRNTALYSFKWNPNLRFNLHIIINNPIHINLSANSLRSHSLQIRRIRLIPLQFPVQNINLLTLFPIIINIRGYCKFRLEDSAFPDLYRTKFPYRFIQFRTSFLYYYYKNKHNNKKRIA